MDPEQIQSMVYVCCAVQDTIEVVKEVFAKQIAGERKDEVRFTEPTVVRMYYNVRCLLNMQKKLINEYPEEGDRLRYDACMSLVRNVQRYVTAKYFHVIGLSNVAEWFLDSTDKFWFKLDKENLSKRKGKREDVKLSERDLPEEFEAVLQRQKDADRPDNWIPHHASALLEAGTPPPIPFPVFRLTASAHIELRAETRKSGVSEKDQKHADSEEEGDPDGDEDAE
jgi:hypothetical protein